MPIDDAIEALRFDRQFMTNVAAWERLPARPARYADFPPRLDSRMIRALRALEIARLYTHQAEAIEAALDRENVVVVTGTASGKTLCYNLPVVQSLLADPEARALYLFPTKALAQDQAAALTGLLRALEAVDQLLVRTYDGDTPRAERRPIRDQARILITNPDMLHTGLLPHHPRWASLLEHLRWIVVDELHVYRGIFGSNVANVFRRLRRLCRFYGADPRLILTSATIANPKELAERLIEAPVRLVSPDLDGSPRAEKHVVIFNPPVVDPALGVRRAYTLEAARLANQFLERRAIERGLREGTVRGVVATNALELGVDIGQLGAAVIAGYPGTIASLWQQAGRAGRRSEASAVVWVASAAPLDQFVAANPRYLFEQPPEHGLINPDNLAILVRHLRCAAFELPFQEGELHSSGGAYRWVADSYPAEGVSLRASSDDTVVIQDVSQGKPVVIGEVDRSTAPLLLHEGAVYTHEGRAHIVSRLDWEKAVAEVEPAELDYYTSASESVDLEVLEVYDAEEALAARRAHGWVQITSQAASFRKVKLYTHETLGYGPIELPPRQFETSAYWTWIATESAARLEAEGVLLAPNDYGPDWPRAKEAALARDGWRCRQCGAPEREGRSHDVHHIRPFREFGYMAGENRNDQLANQLDNLISLCPACHHRAEAARGTRSALGGLAYALGNIAPLFLMCDPRDLGSMVEPRSKETGGPTITLYDRVPEGLGLSERLYELHPQLLEGALSLVQRCGCQDGCPACVGPVGPGGREVKALTERLLQALMAP